MRGITTENYIRPVFSFKMPSPSHNPYKWIFNQWTLSFHDNLLISVVFFSLHLEPDQLVPSDANTTTVATGAVKLEIDERDMSSIPPLSVTTLLQRIFSRLMNHTALCVTRDSKVIWHLFQVKFLGGQSSHVQSILTKWAYFWVYMKMTHIW